jgi:hypothetical protein
MTKSTQRRVDLRESPLMRHITDATDPSYSTRDNGGGLPAVSAVLSPGRLKGEFGVSRAGLPPSPAL